MVLLGKKESDKSGSFFKSKRKLGIFLVVVFSLFSLLLLMDIFLQFFPTGWFILDLQPRFIEGEQIKGNVNLMFSEGELIPLDSLVYFQLGSQEKVFQLADLITSEKNSGNFYAENNYLSGNGEGYGLIGEKRENPIIEFKLKISSLNDNSEGDTPSNPSEEIIDNSSSAVDSSESPSDVIPAEPVSEIAPVENPAESVSENTLSESSFEVQSDSSDSQSLITGAVISYSENIVSGSVSKGNNFVYNLENGESYELIVDSVEVDGESVDSNLLKLTREGNQLIVSTDYEKVENGFGKEFLGNKVLALSIPLENLNLTAEKDSPIEVNLVYQENVLASVKKDLFVIADEKNLTVEQPSNNLSIIQIKDIPTIRIKSGENASIDLAEYFDNAESYGFNVDNVSGVFDSSILNLVVDKGFKGSRKVNIIAYRNNGQEILESNQFLILVSSGAVNINVEQSKVKVGEVVKWTVSVSSDSIENISLDVPASAENISVVKIGENGKETSVEADLIKTDEQGNELVEKINSQEHLSSLTGNVIADVNVKRRNSLFVSFFRNIFSVTGRVVDNSAVSDSFQTAQLNIHANATNYTVEYYTEAPKIAEENLSSGKEVIVYTDSELGYTDILAFTDLNESLDVGQENVLSVYWKENNSYLPFDAYDLNENGKLDYIEWVVPHLSNQTFEIKYGIMSGLTGYCPGNMNGAGNSSDPCEIYNWTQLNATRLNLTVSYILMNDLNSSNGDYTGIGNNWVSIGGNINSFVGIFNGNNHVISNIVISGAVNTVGLFSYSGGNISNLGIINITINTLGATGGAGALAGYQSAGVISNCYSTGSISGISQYGGGLVGYQNSGIISKCYSNVSVIGNYSGGLVGILYGNISDSYSTGNVSGKSFIGGLVGQIAGKIFNSYSISYVTGSISVGGLVGGKYSGSGSAYTSYWDMNTSNQSISAIGTGLTTLQMKSISTFDAWNISYTSNDLNNGYPYLALQETNNSYVWLIRDSSSLTSCAVLDTPGTYTLQNNVSTTGTCFNITADNVTLNGNGYAITGDGSGTSEYGFYASGKQNLTITNFGKVMNFTSGVRFETISNPKIYNSNFTLFSATGVSLVSSNNALVENVSINNSMFGIELWNSNNCLVNHNNLINTSTGVTVGPSINSTVILNNISFANYGIGFDSTVGCHVENNIIASSGYFGIGVGHNSVNNIIKNNSVFLTNNTYTPENPDISYGIVLWDNGSDNIFESNNIYFGSRYGISIQSGNSIYNSFINNQIYSNTYLNIDHRIGGINNLIYNNSFGQISFASNNLTVARNLTFPGNIQISNGSVYVNASAISGLNTSANVTLNLSGFGINLPRIMRDGNACSAPDCNVLNYSNNVLLFNVTSWSNYTVQDASNLTSCGNLSVANTVYTLQNNISTTGTCFNITADNVTLDGSGFSLIGDNVGADWGVYSTGHNNLTVRNFNIYNFSDFGPNDGGGIEFRFSSNSLIENNNLYNISVYGLALSTGTNTTQVRNNNIYGTRGTGILIWSMTHDNRILNNFVSGRGTGGGIGLIYAAGEYNHNNYISSNNITNFGNGIAFANISGALNISNTTLLNNNLFGNLLQSIQQDANSFSNNTLIYNNLYGQIVWNKNNLTTIGDLTFPGNIQIANNSVSFNNVGMSTALNSSANITIYNLPTSFIIPQIIKDGQICNDCYNFTNLNAGNVTFNVSSWSNYTIQDTFDPSNITSCMVLNTANTVYTLQNDINATATCFTINANNTVLDGNGHSIVDINKSTLSYGVYVSGSNTPSGGWYNVTVKNFRDIVDFSNGIYFNGGFTYQGVHNSVIYNNTLSRNRGRGIYITGFSADYITVDSNYVSNTKYESIRSDSTYGIIKNNVFTNASSNLSLYTMMVQNLFELVENNTFANISCLSSSASGRIISIINYGNVFRNNIFANNTCPIFGSNTGTTNNTVIYNNSFGEIKWVYDNLTFINNGSISFPGNIQIANNSVYVNTSAIGGLNTSANVTLDLTGFGINTPRIMKDGTACFAPNCNVLSYSNDVMVFNVSSWSNYTIQDASNLTSCAILDAPGVYILQNNVSTTATCFNITADNITLDGNGYTITGTHTGTALDGEKLIFASGVNNFTLKNILSTNFTIPVYLFDVNNSFISNNTFYRNVDGYSIGIFFKYSNNNVVNNDLFKDSIINFSSGFVGGAGVIYFESGSHNLVMDVEILNNSIYLNDLSGGGILGLGGDTSNNSFRNISILNNNINVSRIWTGGGGIIGVGTQSSCLFDSISILNNGIFIRSDASGGGIIGFRDRVVNFTLSNFYIAGNSVYVNTTYGSYHGTQISYGAIIGLDETVVNNTFTNFTVINNLLSANYGVLGAITLTDWGTKPYGNSFINVNIEQGNADYTIYDISNSGNNIYYNNSYGVLKLTSTNFTTIGNLSFPGNIQISNGSVYVNAFAISGLNTSANVTLNLSGFGINLPRIMKDGNACSAPDCNVLNYSNNVLLFNVTSWSNYTVQDASNLTSCGTLSVANTVYTLQNNISTTGTCFNITADNVTLDGNGYTINGAFTYLGILAFSKNNLTVKNFGGIKNFDLGVSFDGVNNSYIFNNTLINNSGYSAILLAGNENNLTNNLIYSSLSSIAGFAILNPSDGFGRNNNVSGNIIVNASTGITLSSANNFISGNFISGSLVHGIDIWNQLNNTILQNTIVNCTEGIVLANTSSNFLSGNIINGSSNGFALYFASSRNQFINNVVLNSLSYSLLDYDSVANNYLVYNNTFGKITWASTNLTTVGNLTFPGNIQISNGSAYVNISAILGLNSSANITFYGLPIKVSEMYNASVLFNEGNGKMSCSNCNLLNSSDYDSSVTFNVSDFGNSRNYSVGGVDVVALNSGWNSVSFIMDGLTNSSKNISVSTGWNLIGLSGDSNVNVDDLNFTNNGGTKYKWGQAVTGMKMQDAVVNYDSSSKRFKIVRDDAGNNMSKGKGYWVYAREAGNLTLPNVRSSGAGKTFKLSELMFSNGTTEMNLTDAFNEGWFGLSGDENAEDAIRYWDPTGGPGGRGVYRSLSYLDSVELDPNEGYFLWSKKPSISMIRRA